MTDNNDIIRLKRLSLQAYLSLARCLGMGDDCLTPVLKSIIETASDHGFLIEFINIIIGKNEFEVLQNNPVALEELQKHLTEEEIEGLVANKNNIDLSDLNGTWHNDLYQISYAIRGLQKKFADDSVESKYLHKCLNFPATLSALFIFNDHPVGLSDEKKEALHNLRERVDTGIKCSDIFGVLSDLQDIIEPTLKRESKKNLTGILVKIKELSPQCAFPCCS